MGLFETMKYKVIRKIGRIEIREYDDFLLASTKSKLNEKQDSGFMNLFNYISGDNEKNTKISMTTPVVTYKEDNDLVTGFYVGSKYQEDTIPKPKDNVFINKLNNSLYGVIRFSGRWIDKNFDKYDDLLVNYLLKEKYDILSARFILRYQPPFVPWFLRRNEIAYQVRRKNEKPNNKAF